jgi:tRNA(Ile)-lysidine synthetase-like protein
MLITEQVAAFIQRERLLSPGHPVVAAVSGGPDSLCLLDCLQRLEYPILVAHLDHRLRAGSWREAEFVLREARRRGLPSIVERVQPPGLRKRGRSMEEAARIARYDFLVWAATGWGAAIVAAGHTADDQVETILMHFLRGAGVHGLRGMLPKTSLKGWDGQGQAEGGALFRVSTQLATRRRQPAGDDANGVDLIRPLLETTRDQTEAHCRAAGLRPRRDPSNQDPAFFQPTASSPPAGARAWQP